MSGPYYLFDPGSGQPLPCTSLEWVQAFEARCEALRQGQPDPWRVDETLLPDGGTVSTVFLGLDHDFSQVPDAAPVLWETIWFDPFGEARDMDRYSALDDARRGHEKMAGRALQTPEEGPCAT